MAETASECLHCGTTTQQRVEGKPYCSADCIGRRRREQEKEVYRCPYPGCEWEIRWIPGNGLSKAVADREIEEHREGHEGVAVDV